MARRAQALALQRQASDVVWVFAPVGLGVLADAASTAWAIVFAAGAATACVGLFAAWAPEAEPEDAGCAHAHADAGGSSDTASTSLGHRAARATSGRRNAARAAQARGGHA